MQNINIYIYIYIDIGSARFWNQYNQLFEVINAISSRDN